ncbi:hypothetical protein RD792_006965 [Penstemon davidsonii]|uniref:Glycosyltransferase n=1 Tax=Penstemon davidsonii TaxID=160366 RepID=A0ABR0D656_9LAMI|nr:hypothetical protein RD792_006965 [Penstemon davidsonii]
MAKQLINKDERLSITLLIIQPVFDNIKYSHSNNSRIHFIHLPKVESLSSILSITDPISFHTQYIDNHKDHVRNTVAKITTSSNRTLAGFVLDVFCTSMIDVANEFKVPTYVFFTSGASFLGLMFHLQSLRDDQNQDITELYEESGVEITVQSYKNPVPAKLLPSIMLDKNGGSNTFFNHARRLRETKGIMINTFLELESMAIKFLSDEETIPPVYPIGPILHLNNTDGGAEYEEIMKWLDEQPNSSVVFLCFGSKGCFDENQVKEIAIALERSGHRFLWSLRKPPTKHKFESPGEYEHPEEILPEGFFQRTWGIGKVIGWAPQVAVLSHPAVGGFVSHCGWNSTLESVWCGVPMAAWPIYAEQQMNAFELVKDIGVAVEIKMDYKKSRDHVIVTAEEIENGIRRLMEPESDVRGKIEAMNVKSRTALVEGGSSFDSMGRFIDNVIDSIPFHEKILKKVI